MAQEQKEFQDKREEQKWLYKAHIHEQFAINNNANLSSIITLIVAMFGVFYAYGWVLIHTKMQCSTCACNCAFAPFVYLTCDADFYTIDGLLAVTIATMMVLSMILHICAYQGAAQRCGQFIIFNLRYEIDFKPDGKLLPESYKPFKKKWWQITPGIYGELLRITALIEIAIITCSTAFCVQNYNCIYFPIWIYVTCFAFIVVLQLLSLYLQYQKYKNYPKKFTNEIQTLYK